MNEDFSRREMYLIQQGRCFYCDKVLPLNAHCGSRRKWTVDHFWPKVKGHSRKSGKVLACRGCNESKADRDPTDDEICKFLALYRQRIAA